MTIYEKYAKRYAKTPKGAYIRQRANARRRGIEWLFTFETWWEVWQNSGKWERRGRNDRQFCMSRKLDWGPYSPENVVIVTMNKNSKNATKLAFGIGEI